jgi:uncharacterized membrane protein
MSDPMNAGRWKLVIAMSTIGMIGAGTAAKFKLGWKAAAAMTFAELAAVLLYWAGTKDPIIPKLLVFGLIVGFGELPSDAYSVIVKGTLVYPGGEPMIWASPFYMPISWLAIMVQGGFMAWALRQRFGLWKTVLLLVLVGGSYVPLYEYLARNANFWFYQNCPMVLGHTPYYVILAEALLCGALPFLMKDLPGLTWGRAVLFAVVESAVILGSSVLAFNLVG